MSGIGDFVEKAKELVSEHPDEAKGLLGKAEEFISGQTGGQYDEQIKQGEGFLESQLGLGQDAAPATPAAGTPAQ